jgi:hypothetical protein
MYLITTATGRAMRVVNGSNPVEAMHNYHRVEKFYVKAPVYQLSEISKDGRISEISIYCDTWGDVDSRNFSQEARALMRG